MSFEFLRDGQVWLYDSSNYYRLHVSRDVSFSQTFQREEKQNRTLHSLNNLFSGSIFREANPANFSFVLYLISDGGSSAAHQHKPLDYLLQYNGNLLNTFDLFFVYPDYSPQVYYKIKDCVFTNGSFRVEKAKILSVELSGEGSQLTRIEGSFPGTDANYINSVSIATSKEVLAEVEGNTLDNILGVSLEVQNNIEWTKNSTLQNSLSVTNETNTVYPSNFTLSNRSVSGSISQYVNSSVSTSNNNIQTWTNDTTIRIASGIATNNLQFDFNVNLGSPNGTCSFTNRVNTSDVFTQNYDFTLTSNPTNLKQYFTY
ncbi:MAG: phage tail tube protein [Burkholderiaceae bacterium]